MAMEQIEKIGRNLLKSINGRANSNVLLSSSKNSIQIQKMLLVSIKIMVATSMFSSF
jgi:hypothetical protein